MWWDKIGQQLSTIIDNCGRTRLVNNYQQLSTIIEGQDESTISINYQQLWWDKIGQQLPTITNNYQQLSTIIDGQDKATIINNYLQSWVKGMDDKRLIEYADLIYDIIGAAHEVHNELHYGLSEAIYEEALCVELSEMGIEAAHQVELPVFYKGYQLEKHYRLDIVVEDDIIIELKAVDKILSEHRAQLFNYLRITKKPIGVLLNFGKSVYVEKYIYDADTNDVSFFSTTSNRG